MYINMNTYCVSCRSATGNTNATKTVTSNGRLMQKSNCSVCGKKKSGFLPGVAKKKSQKASGILDFLL
jgi:hypothetical protein